VDWLDGARVAVRLGPVVEAVVASCMLPLHKSDTETESFLASETLSESGTFICPIQWQWVLAYVRCVAFGNMYRKVGFCNLTYRPVSLKSSKLQGVCALVVNSHVAILGWAYLVGARGGGRPRVYPARLHLRSSSFCFWPFNAAADLLLLQTILPSLSCPPRPAPLLLPPPPCWASIPPGNRRFCRK
jgi:hypothetical protein